jgi:putative transposase
LRALVRTALQEMLEAEMTEALGAEKGERTAGRQGYRSAITAGPWSRGSANWSCGYRRIEPDGSRPSCSSAISAQRALVAALAEMYVQGVSTRKVKAITEESCGHSFPLSDPWRALWAGARRWVIASQAVLIAIGIDWSGRRQMLAVELANRERRSSWRDFLLRLKARGLRGGEFVIADDHAGFRPALREVLAQAAY